MNEAGLNDNSIYYCGIQKTGSQWIKKILGDPLVRAVTGMDIFTTELDFIGLKNRDKLKDELANHLLLETGYETNENWT